MDTLGNTVDIESLERERERKIGRERERKKEEEKERKTCSDQGDCGALGQDWGAQKKTS